MFKKYKIQHCYTIECNYTKGVNRYSISELTAQRDNPEFTTKEF